jgi:tripartite ATP-independent transporter DctM subunit
MAGAFMTTQSASLNNTLSSKFLKPLEFISALLLVVIIVMLLIGVVSRYVFAIPIIWIDEVVSLSFLWFAMIGTAIAMYRNEHLRLSLFLEMMPVKIQGFVHATALVSIAAFLIAMIHPSIIYAQEEWFVKSPALNIPNTYRVSALAFGFLAMLCILLVYALKTVTKRHLLSAVVTVSTISAACWLGSSLLFELGILNIVIFLIVLVALCLVAGVPIAFCFGLGALSYLAFATTVPLMVVIGRMDEGMSSLILVSVPIFVLLGCVLDATGMGKAIVGFLASLLGHIKAGMSYVLLGSLFIVSGISGSKVSDMATIAPALFPEMKRRGHKPKEMIALLATGAAMADTVPPSIVLIVLGSVAGVSIAGLFQSGVVIAMVLLIALAVLARWKARNEIMDQVSRSSMPIIGRALIIAAPALVLPFLIRSAVGGGVATATEVSTIAVLYAMIIGQVLYGGLGWKKVYDMLVETAALSGAILLILGTASAMAWAITQSGVVQSLSQFLTTLPGGVVSFMIVTILIFLILGCLLEGLPAILILAPIMFPIARKLGIHDIHYSMVVVTAMNIGLMMPPIGIGFFVACRIGNTSPDEVMGAIWPYILALIAGLVLIAAFPWFSTVAL